MEKQIYDLLTAVQNGEQSIGEAQEQLLLLFSVMESDCDHEWINHSFDHFGFLQEQICDKCGAKQSVP